MSDDYLVVSVHDFKTNFSRYMRILETKQKRGIVVRRFKKRIAMVISAQRERPSSQNVD